MNMSPLSSPVPFAVLQGKGDLESAPKQMPLEEAKLEKPAGSAHPPQTDKPRDGDFAAVLAAARPQAASANPIGKAPVAPLAQMTDEALATLVADANDLIATFQAESGTPDLAEMIASFVVSLQAFDAATGGEAMSVLAKNLGQLDASGLARLEAAALDPAALFAALASLAGIPVTNSAGALIQMPKALQSFWSQEDAVLVETRVSTPGQIREGLLPSRTAAPTLDPELAVNPLQPQPSSPADMRMDARTAVMNALAATVARCRGRSGPCSAVGNPPHHVECPRNGAAGRCLAAACLWFCAQPCAADPHSQVRRWSYKDFPGAARFGRDRDRYASG